MPAIQAVPTWLAWNNCNFTSPTGLTDMATGQQIAGGGLNGGDYFSATNDEAAQASFTTNGLLYAGRYRLVQVDSGATAANVKTGTVGYLAAGKTVKSVVVLTAGSGQTAGVYTVAANNPSAGGTGAIIQVIVNANGTVTAQPTVLQGGSNYTSQPTFTLAAGGTPATFSSQLNSTPNVVTSADVQLLAGGVGAVRPVIFLNSITPGNWGFVQELGTATVLATAAQTQAVNQFAIAASGPGTGLMTASSATFSIFAIGQVIDPIAAPLVGTPFKIQLGIGATIVAD